MPKLRFTISVSLDGFVAGTSPTAQNPLGEGGDQLHEWRFAAEAPGVTHVKYRVA